MFAGHANPPLVMKRVAFYIDSHGFGHSTRSISLAARFPVDWNLQIKTNAPSWLFQEELGRDHEIHPSDLDIHPIQSHGYRVDVAGTLQSLLRKMDRVESLVERERIWLEEQEIDLVLSDISPLAIEAAYRASVPCFGISNFSWHWILEPMCPDLSFKIALQKLEQMVGHASANFRLPFSLPEVFPGTSIDTPLLARLPRASREQIRSEWGFDPEGKYVLVTFGGFDRPDRNLVRLADLSPLQFIRVLPHAERTRERGSEVLRRDERIRNLWHFVHPRLHHPDLVGAVDAVITKPGYGILSETMPLGIPLLLDRREDFREFQVIESTLSDYPQVSFLPSDRMADFDFIEELAKVLEGPRQPWRGAFDGAEFILDRIQ